MIQKTSFAVPMVTEGIFVAKYRIVRKQSAYKDDKDKIKMKDQYIVQKISEIINDINTFDTLEDAKLHKLNLELYKKLKIIE